MIICLSLEHLLPHADLIEKQDYQRILVSIALKTKILSVNKVFFLYIVACVIYSVARREGGVR